MKKVTLIRIFHRLLPMAFSASPLLFIFCTAFGIVHGLLYGVSTLITHQFFDTVTDAVNGISSVNIVIWMGIALGSIMIGTELVNGLHNFVGQTYVKKATGFLNMKINEKATRIEPMAYENPDYLDDIN
jgi:ATP-binding cassette, subfamily B, bacterial